MAARHVALGSKGFSLEIILVCVQLLGVCCRAFSSHLVIFVGRFLCSMLEIVMRWHGDKKTYEKVGQLSAQSVLKAFLANIPTLARQGSSTGTM